MNSSLLKIDFPTIRAGSAQTKRAMIQLQAGSKLGQADFEPPMARIEVGLATTLVKRIPTTLSLVRAPRKFQKEKGMEKERDEEPKMSNQVNTFYLPLIKFI